MNLNTITLNEYKKIIAKHKKVVLFFKTKKYEYKYNIHCIIDFITKQYPDIHIIEINIEYDTFLADSFKIDTLPTFVYLLYGKKRHQENGIQNNGKNIMWCFANLIVTEEYINKKHILQKQDPTIIKEYNDKVLSLHKKMVQEYSLFLKE